MRPSLSLSLQLRTRHLTMAPLSCKLLLAIAIGLAGVARGTLAGDIKPQACSAIDAEFTCTDGAVKDDNATCAGVTSGVSDFGDGVVTCGASDFGDWTVRTPSLPPECYFACCLVSTKATLFAVGVAQCNVQKLL